VRLNPLTESANGPARFCSRRYRVDALPMTQCAPALISAFCTLLRNFAGLSDVKYLQPMDSTPFRALAARIHRALEGDKRCTVYEFELIRVWPLNEKDREAKIATFATEHGFRLQYYRIGWCAIFEQPR
jgi:hypothetical protein